MNKYRQFKLAKRDNCDELLVKKLKFISKNILIVQSAKNGKQTLRTSKTQKWPVAHQRRFRNSEQKLLTTMDGSKFIKRMM